MREIVARAACANGGNGFCHNMGGDFGCKCGRGEMPHWSKCVATPDQLILSGNADLADAVLAAMREPTNQMIMAGIIERHDAETPEAWKLATAHIYTAMIDAARAPSS